LSDPTRVAVLGSTGSIGRQTLEVLRELRSDFTVGALAAGHADAAFEAQLRTWPGAVAWTADGGVVADARPRWAAGGLEELATLDDIDIVVVATTGMAALPAVLAALRRGKTVALANKETLVTGGHLVAAALEASGRDPLDALRPIDSEHSAIWQCLVGEDLHAVERLVLTASGGPFRGRDVATLAAVTPREALAHPTWRMGAKVTIDSATMVNKAFEAIEARWLYGIAYPRIDAVIHPQSVVHSLVEFADGAYKAQLGLPDMRLPIQYALTFPHRVPSPARRSGPEAWGTLSFEPLNRGAYPAYDVVRDAAHAGGNRGAVVNAADEVAVAAFLAGRVGFGRIPTLIAEAIDTWGADAEPALDEITVLDREVRDALSARVGLKVD
jgi:1-deoxy-D-xylulose-5-phosphate reductoisomerase